MDIFFGALLSYVVSFAVNEHSNVIHKRREARLQKILNNTNALSRALSSKRSVQDEVALACIRLAQDKDKLGVGPMEAPLWELLSEPEFQVLVSEWIMAGNIVEGDQIKASLLQRINNALASVDPQFIQARELGGEFFEQLERAIFSNELLAKWRHQQSLNYLRTQVAVLRERADEAAGVFSSEKQTAALNEYCDEALKAWDIIDLTNLPEGDVDVATQNLLIRQLYMPLRISIEQGKDVDAALADMEEERDIRRKREAGYVVPFEEDTVAPSNEGIGDWLKQFHRLVVLGDPGGGKTTMLRWLATAMLLRYRGDPAVQQLPDMATLPDQQWIPVLIRCRDLGESDLCRSFLDFLGQHLLKSSLHPDKAKIMHALILERIVHNQVLLMIDGLDEISNAQVRVRFCQELERTAARYPGAPIIVTSRIVGYRDIPYRMGKEFKHGVIAELHREHKDLFAKRWIEATEQRQSSDERAKREKELVAALHSSDRIERLTSNPMLLTTLALVKRKVGKLPSRRNKLYAEAVAVLLNWNPGYYTPIDETEALPQLEYLAYEMCRRGVQRLSDDEIMDLLEQFRKEYPSVRAVRFHSEREFLALLEARSSILIKAGNVWRKGLRREEPAWEFRHLTFQEYLAAQALIDGKYPNRDKTLSLARQVAPLAGMIQVNQNLVDHRYDDDDDDDDGDNDEENVFKSEIPESWREAIRLLVADCKDDDVDDVLYAVLTPQELEDESITQRTRAVLAGLCLADEPNVSEETAHNILDCLMDVVRPEDGDGTYRSPLADAISELLQSQWYEETKKRLVGRYLSDTIREDDKYGGLWGFATANQLSDHVDLQSFLSVLADKILSLDRLESTAAALTIMNLAYDGRINSVPRHIIDALISMLPRDWDQCNAAAWALGWISSRVDANGPLWRANPADVEIIAQCLASTPESDVDTQFWLLKILGYSESAAAIVHVEAFVNSDHERPRTSAREALISLAMHDNEQLVVKLLAHPDESFQLELAQKLARKGDSRGLDILIKSWHSRDDTLFEVGHGILSAEPDPLSRKLLSRNLNTTTPLIRPGKRIDENRISACVEKLGLERSEVIARYQTLAQKYRLKLADNLLL